MTESDENPGLRARHWLTWASTLAVVMGMIGLAAGKIVVAEDETRFVEFFKYLTNISWTLQTIFYFYSVLFFFGDDALRVLIFVGYFPILGLTVVVFALITFVFEYNSDLLTEAFDKYGVGTVVTLNTVFHYLTVLVIIIFGIGFSDYLYDAHRTAWEGAGWWLRAFYVIYQGFLPIFLVAAYNVVVDVHAIYGETVPDAGGWIVGIVALLCVTLVYGVFVLSFSRQTEGMVVLKHKKKTRRTDFYSPINA